MQNDEMCFYGDRVYLKKISVSEIDDTFMSWFSNEELMKYYTNSGDKITKEKILNSISDGEVSKTNYTYGIYDKTNSKCIGTIKIGPINLKHKISDLVVLIGDVSYHGKGLAPEAISLGNKIAFDVYDIRKLYGGMYETNISSIKSYTKAGWVIEGRLNGHYLVDGNQIDRILVGCFNPKYFKEIE
jgi:ribosomal-protein-alanine N-acetyltransferase